MPHAYKLTLQESVINTVISHIGHSLLPCIAVLLTACAPMRTPASVTKSDADMKTAPSLPAVEAMSVPSHAAEITTVGVSASTRASTTAVSASVPQREPVAPTAVIPVIYASDDNASVIGVQRIPFRAGVSSVTVERLARQYGCNGGKGAALITDEGPVEMYRMICDTGAVFLAKCDLRQCVPFK